MLIRYRANSSITATNLMADFHAIITGQITTVNDFSAGCDKTNSSIEGTYPAAVYASVQNDSSTGTYTYSKVHNAYADVTHYFRLNFSADSPMLQTVSLSSGWNSGSNTMINSQSMTREFIVHGITISNISFNLATIGSFNNPDAAQWGFNNGRSSGLAVGDRIEPTTNYPTVTLPLRQTRITSQSTGTTGNTGDYYVNIAQQTGTINYPCTVNRETTALNAVPLAYNSSYQPTGIDIVITDKFFFISWPGAGLQHGIFDLGKNGVTEQNANSMLMGMIDLRSQFIKIPYYYKLSTASYGTIVDVDLVYETPVRIANSNQSISIIENPVIGKISENGNPATATYGLFRIADSLVPGTAYTGPSSVKRFVPVSNYSLITE